MRIPAPRSDGLIHHRRATSAVAALRGVQPGVRWGTAGRSARGVEHDAVRYLLHTSSSAQAAVDARAVSGGRLAASNRRARWCRPPTRPSLQSAAAGRKHHVVVGSSWGFCPALRQWWTSADCDRLSLASGGLASRCRYTVRLAARQRAGAESARHRGVRLAERRVSVDAARAHGAGRLQLGHASGAPSAALDAAELRQARELKRRHFV